METVTTDIKTKKELGQYFSGEKIARLLIALSKSEHVNSIIDPMCGIGDMLYGFRNIDNTISSFHGVEIDESILNIAYERLNSVNNLNIIHGNAFDINILKSISRKQYDLVITNPPYVRYQTIANGNAEIANFLDASSIRRNLHSAIPFFNHLTNNDKAIVKTLVESYSGLSDLAVPSWILSSLLTKVGGRLAIVVPQTWLNRNYASIIQYLLLRWFQIEYIIEDEHSCWFSNAQVKTTLLVAKRIDCKSSISSWGNETFQYCSISSKSINSVSLVGNAFPASKNPELDFVNSLNKMEFSNKFYSLKSISIKEFATELQNKILNTKWYKVLEKNNISSSQSIQIKAPSNLASWLGERKYKFNTLNELGVSVSQGLRTGANNFFYLDVIKKHEGGAFLKPNKKNGYEEFYVHSSLFKEVLRKQSELTDSYSIENIETSGVVLYLQNQALPDDINNQDIFTNGYTPVSTDLEAYIKYSSSLNIGTNEVPKYFPQLSAVKPNVRLRKVNSSDESSRFWYMLPEFSKRHFGELFVPRVNGKLPKVRLNKQNSIIIDANFSTICLDNELPHFNRFTLLALLNCTWCLIGMEEYGTVLGGGALKLEATQIKQIPIPLLGNDKLNKLSVLGKQLAQAQTPDNNIIHKIDLIIIESLGFKENANTKVQELISIKEKLLKSRSKK